MQMDYKNVWNGWEMDFWGPRLRRCEGFCEKHDGNGLGNDDPPAWQVKMQTPVRFSIFGDMGV